MHMFAIEKPSKCAFIQHDDKKSNCNHFAVYLKKLEGDPRTRVSGTQLLFAVKTLRLSMSN